MADPAELFRVVAGPDGGLEIGRLLPGRGAWLCRDSPRCVEMATRRKAFNRALRTDIRIDAVAVLQSSTADRARMEGFASSGPAAG